MYHKTRAEKLKLVLSNAVNRNHTYSETFDINRTLAGNQIVDHSDVVGA